MMVLVVIVVVVVMTMVVAWFLYDLGTRSSTEGRLVLNYS